VNTIGDKTRQFCLVSTQFPVSRFSTVINVFETELTVANWKLIGNSRLKTKLSCLVANCVHTADTDKTVLSV